ncbi:MAG: DMT family transporter [Armatimonadota bacterium]
MTEAQKNSERALYGYIGIIASATFTGLNWPLLKDLMSQVSPLQANWLVIIPALVMIVPLYAWYRRNQALLPPHTPYKWLLIFGLFASAIFYCRNVGTHLTTATTAALVVRMELAFVFILSYIILKTRVTALGWAGSALLLAGALLASGFSFGNLAFDWLGVGALFVAAALTALNSMIIKIFFGRIPAELPAIASCICQTVVFSCVLGFSGRIPETVAAVQNPRVAVESLIGGVFMVLLLVLYYFAMKRIPVWLCRILTLFSTVVAMLGDHFWLGSDITVGQLAGFAGVIGGAVLVVLASRGSRPDQIPEHLDRKETATS